MRLLDINGNPLSGKNCTLDWTGAITKGTTDGSGVFEANVASRDKNGDLTVELFKDTNKNPVIHVILKPPVAADQVEGLKRRLNNLGYLALGGSAVGGMDDPGVRALDRFRFTNGIVNADGTAKGPKAAPFDPETKNRIENAHDTLGPLEALPAPTP